MCKCRPNVKTPYCGRLGCEWPEKERRIYFIKFLGTENYHIKFDNLTKTYISNHNILYPQAPLDVDYIKTSIIDEEKVGIYGNPLDMVILCHGDRNIVSEQLIKSSIIHKWTRHLKFDDLTTEKHND